MNNTGAEITCLTPASISSGPKDVTVSCGSNGSATLQGAFTYNALPTVACVSPVSGPLAGGTSLTITGTGFGGSVGVVVGTLTASNVAASTEGTTVTCLTPNSTVTGAMDVTINSSANGSAIAAQAFTYNSPPAITTISPTSGAMAGGTNLTIGGSGFDGVVGVTLGTATAMIDQVTGTTITCVTPAAASAGAVDVTVTSSTRGSITKTSGYTYIAPPTISFAAPITYTVGTGSGRVIFADMNEDSRPDLVCSTYDAASILMNATPTEATTPTFMSAQQFSAGGSLEVSSDLDGDGRPDLVFRFVSIRQNQTPQGALAPSFAQEVDLFTIGAVSGGGISVADFNQDGKADVANTIPDAGSQGLQVFLNTTATLGSTPTFAAPVGFTGSATAYESHVATDLNSDGAIDLVVGAAYTTGATGITFYMNRTSARSTTLSFDPPVSVPTGNGAASVASGDLNADGKPDFVVANWGETLSILLNTTPPGAINPSFATKVDLSTRFLPSGVVVADFTGDGKPDIAVVCSGDLYVSIFENLTPTGSTVAAFGPRVDVPIVDTGADSIAARDVNGDGKIDIAVLGSGIVQVLLNSCP